MVSTVLDPGYYPSPRHSQEILNVHASTLLEYNCVFRPLRAKSGRDIAICVQYVKYRSDLFYATNW
jgi:hypothetical protein